MICKNCGAESTGNTAFCSGCGTALYAQPVRQQQQHNQQQQQYNQQSLYQPQYVPAPVTAKKKSKTPFIIAGAAVLVIALVVVAFVTNGFGIFGETAVPPVTVQVSPPPESEQTPTPPEPTVDFIIGTWVFDTVYTTDNTMGWEEYSEQLLAAGYTELIIEITFTDDGHATRNYLGETDNCTWSGNGDKYILTSSSGISADIEIVDEKLIFRYEDEDNTTMAFIKKTSEDEPTSDPAPVSNGGYHDSPQGSAKFLEGKVLLVSIFVDLEDEKYKWSQDDYDALKEKYVLSKEFLEAEAKRYGKDLEFVCDFEANPDLFYRVSATEEQIALFDDKQESLLGSVESFIEFFETIGNLNDFIEDYIPYRELVDKYGTDSINYSFQLKRWAPTCFAISHNPDTLGNTSYHEKFLMSDMVQWDARTFSHEILHNYGAVDLYVLNLVNGVSDALVEHAKANYPRDIMSPLYGEPVHDSINYEISPITAYCLGWLDDIPELSMFPELKRHTPAAFYDHQRYVDPDSIDTGNIIPPSGGRIPISGITEFAFTPDHSDVWIFTSTDCGSNKVLIEIFDDQHDKLGGSRMGGGRTEEGGSNAFYAIWINEGETFYIRASFADAAVGDNAYGSYTLIVENPETLPDNGGTGYLVNSAHKQYYFTPNESGIWEIRHSDSDGADIYYTILTASDDNQRGVYTKSIGMARPEDSSENDYISVHLEAGVKYMINLASMDNFSNYTVTVSKK